MNYKLINKTITLLIALVWLTNGLFCKVLNFVPRHTAIVARILGEEYATPLTALIGISEIFMFVWIIIGYKAKLNALLQIVIIAMMNTIEFLLAPDLLLWGKYNSLFAAILILVIYVNEFVLKSKTTIR